MNSHDDEFGVVDPRSKNVVVENRAQIRLLSESLPKMIKDKVDARIIDMVADLKREVALTKDLQKGCEKSVVELLHWKNKGAMIYRDDLISTWWACAMLGLTNSDQNNSFERLVAIVQWAADAYISASRQNGARKFLGKYFTSLIRR